MKKKLKYVCFYHPDRSAFVEVGRGDKKFYVCRECFLNGNREQWDNDLNNPKK